MDGWEDFYADAKAVVDAVAPSMDADPGWRDRLYFDMKRGVDEDDVVESALNAAVTFGAFVPAGVLDAARRVAGDPNSRGDDEPPAFIVQHIATLEERAASVA